MIDFLNTMAALKQLRAEGKPLLYAILPIALLAAWRLQRLEFHPVKGGEPVTFAAYFPVSRAGEVAHLVPQPGLKAEDGWVKELVAVTNDGPAYARASWRCSDGADGVSAGGCGGGAAAETLVKSLLKS